MNVRLRNMTSIYISQNGRMLLLYRVGSRVVAPSWCGIGGHFEEEERNDPRICVLREMKEEIGLTEDDLENISMRYVTLRLKYGEIRQNYYFFADLKPHAVIKGDCKEGKTEWVDYGRVLERTMPYTAENVLRHYFSEGINRDCVYGGVTREGETVFTELEEF